MKCERIMISLHNKPLKILIGPHEIGGQGQLMAETLRRRGHFATSISFSQEWYGHVNDINFGFKKGQNKFKKQFKIFSFFIWAVQNYEIFHFFWGTSLLGSRFFYHYDLPILKRMGKRIFVHFRGSDIRNLSYFDYLSAKAKGLKVKRPPISRPHQIRSLKCWKKYADLIFVSEPGLLSIVPDAIVVPQVIDLCQWEFPFRKLSDDGTFRIIHAPTRRNAKGTEFVIRAVKELKAEGQAVELVLVEGIPASKMIELYKSCDIGIDQLLYGWYGKVSIELMALGIPAICYIDHNLLRYHPNLPIVSANPHTLKETIDRLIRDKATRLKIAEQGRKYVRKYHDANQVVNKLLDLYTK